MAACKGSNMEDEDTNSDDDRDLLQVA